MTVHKAIHDPRANARVCLVALTLLLVLTSRAHADRFILDDDQHIDGAVVSDDGDVYVVRTADGVVSIRKEGVKKRRRITTDFERYLRKAKSLRRNSARAASWSAQLKLATWCRAKKLPTQALEHYKKVLELQPNNFEAQSAVEELTPKKSASRAKASEQPAEESAQRTPNSIRFVQKGTLGSSNAQGYLKQELGAFFKTLDTPLCLRSAESECAFVLEVQIAAKFVKTTKFYNRIPISDRYEGAVSLRFYEHDKRGKPIVKLKKLKYPMDLPTKMGRKRAIELVRQQALEEILVRLSNDRYFRKLGAEPRKHRN